MLEPQQLFYSVLAGAGVGFLSGVFGAGGGFLIVPVLSIVLRVPVNLAVGAAAAQVLGPATTSLLARRMQWRELELPLMIAGGQVVGAFLGAELLERTRGGTITIGGRSLDAAELIVMVVYLVILLSIGTFTIVESRRGGTREGAVGPLANWRLPPLCAPSEFNGRTVSIPLLTWFGLSIGFFSGLLGIGGAFLLLPGLIYLWGIRTQPAVRASLVMIWFGAVPATIAHAWHDNIDLPLLMALLAGGTLGARLGSEVGERLSGPKLRNRFAWVMLLTAVLVAYRLVSLIW